MTSTTKALVAVVVLLLAQVAYQAYRINQLKGQLAYERRHVDERAGELASQRLEGHREDIARAAQWLQDYYASDAGLRRPSGLWNEQARQLDAEAIGAWIFDVYLHARLNGATHEDARRAVEDSIRSTDEWRRAHPSS